MSVSQSNPSISAETDFGAARAGSAPPGRRSVTGFAQRKKRIGGGGGGANGIEEGGGGDDSSANASPLLSGIGEDISTSQGSPAASAAMAAAAALAANNAAEAKALAVAGLAGPGEGGRGGGGGGVGGTELTGNTPVAIISEQVEQAYTPCGALGREQIDVLSLFIDIGHTYSLNSSLI